MEYKVKLLLDTDILMDYDDIQIDRDYNSIYADDKIYLRLITEGKKAKGTCVNYATKQYKLEYVEDILPYLHDNYLQIPISELKRGDLAIFYYVDKDYGDKLTEYNIEHLAKVFKTDRTLNGTYIRSKWGENGVFETNLYTLPDVYGNKVSFWRKK